jgi:hypothetical protein
LLSISAEGHHPEAERPHLTQTGSGTLNLPLRVEARASGVVPLAQSGRAPSPLPPPLCTREPRSRALDPDYLLAQGTGRLNELHLAAKVGWCSGG